MIYTPIADDQPGLMAGDTGTLISLVFDFQINRLTEYRTDYEVGYATGGFARAGVLKYREPHHAVDPTQGRRWLCMSRQRLGQYELMTVKSSHGVRFYARVFTIKELRDKHTAVLWKQLYRNLLRQHMQPWDCNRDYAAGEPVKQPIF